jgi:transcriptional regulator with XRE-family HTH domain
MSVQVQISLRSRKLGVLMRDARLKARKTIPECAQAIGVKPAVFRSYEEGRRAASLPEMEMFAFYMGLSVSHFWGREAATAEKTGAQPSNMSAVMSVRQRMIGAMLRQQRLQESMSIKALADQTGLPTSRITAYELGERPIPLPELEVLIHLLGGNVENLFDQTGPIGKWMNEQKAIQDFLMLPQELKEFVCKPVNRPYLELALRLSGMSVDKLRTVAEGILDITL